MNNKLFRLIYKGKLYIFPLYAFFLWWISNKKKPIQIVEDHLMNIPTKFGFNWPIGFRDNQNAKVYVEQRIRRRTQSDDNTPHDPLGQMRLKKERNQHTQ